MLCKYCQKEFETDNLRRKYCSTRCNNLSYQKRRYAADGEFRSRRRSCWVTCGRCNICGRPMSKGDTCDHGIKDSKNDSESLFGSPESKTKVAVMLAATRHPDYDAGQIIEMFQDTGLPKEVIRKIVEEVLT